MVGDWGGVINDFLKSFLVIGVPLFFFCNGYLLFGKTIDLKKHCKKVIRQFAVCIIWELITMVWFSYLEIIDVHAIDIKYALMDAYGYFAHFWFIGALSCIYLLFPLLKYIYDQNRPLFLFFVLICFVFTFGNKIIILFLNIRNYFTGAPFSYDNYFGMFNLFRGIYGYTFVYFCFGGIARWFEEKYEGYLHAHQLKIMVLAAVCFLLSTGLLWGYGAFYSNMTHRIWDVVAESYDAVFALISTLCIYMLTLCLKDGAGKVTRLVSANTLGIYYMHMLFIHWLFRRFPDIGRRGVLEDVIYSTAVITVCLLISMVMKRVPLIKNMF